MKVKKRNGELEEVAFDKILSRVKKLGQEVSIQINYQQLVIKIGIVINQNHLQVLHHGEFIILETINRQALKISCKYFVKNLM